MKKTENNHTDNGDNRDIHIDMNQEMNHNNNQNSNNSNGMDIDDISRNKIITEIDKNLFVEAGAGSGKTTMLVNRMVAMVEAGRDISKICAITFTKAAAGEFYKRFRQVLLDRSNPELVWEDKGYAGQLPEPTSETRDRCAEALKYIDLCFMGTIDSFCNMILSEHPSEAGIPSNSSIISDGDAKKLYDKLYVDISKGKYGSELKKLSQNFRIVNNHAQDAFSISMAKLMDKRNAKFDCNEITELHIGRDFGDDIAAIKPLVQFLLNHPEIYDRVSKNDAEKNAIDFMRKANGIIGDVESNFGAFISGLDKLKNLRLTAAGGDQYIDELQGYFEKKSYRGKSYYVFALDDSDSLLDRMYNYQYDVSMTFLLHCLDIMEAYSKNQGKLTFFDNLYYLRNMMRADAMDKGELIKYIYSRHSYFLIDEFQDTDPLQSELFFYLTAAEPVAKWYECQPQQGSLFIVGDPKQSIYRFRRADVSAFLRVKKLFAASVGEVLQLTKNFRSTLQVQSYFNSTFSKLLPAETNEQSKFTEIPLPDKEADGFQGIFTYTKNSGKDTDSDVKLQDHEQIGRIITRLVDNDAFKIPDKDTHQLRKLRYDDFMIITAGKTSLSPIMQELYKLDIPMKVEGKVLFESNTALQVIDKIFSAVADPSNSVALYGALVGDVFKISPELLLEYKYYGGRISLYNSNKVSNSNNIKESGQEQEKPSYDFTSVEKALCILQDIFSKAKALSPAALFDEIINSLSIYEHVETDNLEVLYYTLELLRSKENVGVIISLADGAQYIHNLVIGGADEERCLSLTDKSNRVHLANLHKVKGLEATVVILAKGSDSHQGNDIRIEIATDDSKGYVFAISDKYDTHNITLFKTNRYEKGKDGYQSKKECEKVSQEAEGKRHLYVAGTRARNVLIINNQVKKDGTPDGRAKWSNLIADYLPDIFNKFEEKNPKGNIGKAEITVGANKCFSAKTSVQTTDLYAKAKAEAVLNNRSGEAASFIVESPSKIAAISRYCVGDDDNAESILNSSASLSEGAEAAGSSEKMADASTAGIIVSGKVVELPKKVAQAVHRFPTLLGTMVHRLMELMVSSHDTFDSQAAAKEAVEEYITVEAQPIADQFTQALEYVSGIMHYGGFAQANDAPQDMLKELLSADECYCELPFCYQTEPAANEEPTECKRIWNGVIDVLYHKDGKWHIIDYKTNVDGSDLDQHYHAQLMAYKQAVQAISGNEIADAKIYHIPI